MNFQHNIQPQPKRIALSRPWLYRVFTKKKPNFYLHQVFGTCLPWVVEWSCTLEELLVSSGSGESQFVSAVESIREKKHRFKKNLT